MDFFLQDNQTLAKTNPKIISLRYNKVKAEDRESKITSNLMAVETI